MKKLLALIVARNKEFYRDRTALVWSIMFPFIVLAGFTYGSSGKQDPLLRVRVLWGTALTQPVIEDLKTIPGVEVVASDDEPATLKRLEHHQVDLVVSVQDGGARLLYAFNADSDKGKLAERLLRDTVERHAGPRPALALRTVEGRRIRFSDWLLPGLLAMNVMFGAMFGVGYVVVRYRKNGVLKRLRATPLSALQFLSAQVISRMMLMLITTHLVLGGAMVLIGFRSQGSWLDLVVFLSVSSATMISLGLVVAARISSEEVAEGVLNLMTWPMIFLSGIWFSLDGATSWVQWGSKVMPLTHVVDGLRAILIEGASLADLVPQLTVLSVLSVVFLGIGSAIFRWR